MSCFLDQILEKPSYGYERAGKFYAPTHYELIREFLHNVNPFRTRKNWLTFFSWTMSLSLGIPLAVFFLYYFTWPLFILGFFYIIV
jgi:stearoyl-CoA desaturase (delta-9 desaturase)